MKKIMLIVLSIIAVLVLGVTLFMQTPRFGKHPKGDRLLQLEKSPNYKNGQFQNLSPTPMITEGASYWSMTLEFFTGKVKEPQSLLPSTKTNLKALSPTEDVLVWMGHSSYFMQIGGKKVLVDPVFCGYASPVSFTTKAYAGSDVYTSDDIPDIDYLIITHDHWDHLDYKTIKALKPKIKQVICGLGNGAHFEHWRYESSQILERDWYESIQLDDGFQIHVTPARHFSGRGFKRNQALWASFVFVTPTTNIYIGGDSGYDKHFLEIGEKYGPFDLAILENGQYDKNWKYIHLMPGEHIKAANDLKVKTIFPVHSGKFTLGNHDWDEPLTKIVEYQGQDDLRILTPMIGEQVNLNDTNQQFTHWWRDVK